MDSWPIIGHDLAVQQLRLDVARDAIPHALLITGPENVGKSTLAQLIAQTALCTADTTARPCNHCSACQRVISQNHPDLRLVTPEEPGKGVKIDQIRALERFLSLTPREGRHKIAIIHAFELANRNAANALLKTLEEPPAYAHLILLATNTDTLLPTIVSRSQHIPLRPLQHDTVKQGLMEQWHVGAEQAERIARLSGGRMGWAIQAITHPEHLQKMEQAAELLLQILRSDLVARFKIAETLAQDNAQLAQTLEYWRGSWRDILLLQTQNPGQITYLDAQESLTSIGKQLGVRTTAQTLRALEKSQEALQRHANTRLLVEALLLNLPAL